MFKNDLILENFQQNIFYHGTCKRNARKLIHTPFRDWCVPSRTPLLKHLAARHPHRYLHDGAFGRGVYITCNWRGALFFGPVLFKVQLRPGTRIVNLDLPADTDVIDGVTREFGREILRRPAWKVLPKNKQLTLSETINLARYHHAQTVGKNFMAGRFSLHWDLLADTRKMLVRHGVHGFGEPTDLNGIVVFAADRILAAEIVMTVPQRIHQSAPHTETPFEAFRSLPEMQAGVEADRSPTIQTSRRWMAESNVILCAKNGTAKRP